MNVLDTPNNQKCIGKKAQSCINSLSIGDERKCLNQIYKAANQNTDGVVDPNWLLYNGMTAGHFSTLYIVGHHNKRKKKETAKKEYIAAQKKSIDCDNM